MALSIALILDAILGEPDWLWSRVPHPAVVMGRIIGWTDRSFNRGRRRKINGIISLAILVLSAGLLGLGLRALPWIAAEILIGAVLVAQKSLVEHVRAVALALERDLAAGREAVAQIVGRDTGAMDEPAVARAAIESAAENFSDGVVAPVFWFAVAGLPGLLVYKLVNTADSMIGYRTPEHEAFGWAAARLDDLLNWIPARLTSALFALSALRLDVWPVVLRDAPLHRSPNAGWPEAAMAAVLDVAVAGPRSYEGVLREYPWVNPDGRRQIGAPAIRAAVRMLWRAWAVLLGLTLLLWLA